MASFLFISTSAILWAVALAAEPLSASDMGPAAFLWPQERMWSADMDNTEPCGSSETIRNRTMFPMSNGHVALVDKKEAYNLQLSIAYQENPKSNSDFTPLIKPENFPDVDLGHTCVSVADAPSTVKAGSNATLQIKYTATFDHPQNETFYACADITYVELPNFKDHIPCFNASQPDKSTATGSPSPSSSSPSNIASSSGLSGGAIAGTVVGVVGGLSLLVAGALLIYRRKQQRLRMLRQQNSARGVKWDQQRDSNSNRSVRLQNLS